MKSIDMNYSTVKEVFEKNRSYRKKLLLIVSELPEGGAEYRQEADAWSIAEILEHLATSNAGMILIISRLLDESALEENSGKFVITPEFGEKLLAVANKKRNAPRQVLPTNSITISESLAQLNATNNELSILEKRFERIDGTQNSFPHPLFGDLTAHDWLLLLGLHEARHTAQIKKTIESNK